MENHIRFNCTQCGQCCSKPPSFNFYEMLELSDEFIFQTSHHSIISKTSELLDKSVALHYQKIGHAIVMPELDATMFYFIDFTPVQLASYKSCSKLKDKECSIYGKRPDSCRISPGSFYLPLHLQPNQINNFKKQKNFECDFSDQAPIFFDTKENEFSVSYNNTIYNRNISTIRETTDIFIEFLESMNEERKNNHFKAVFTALSRNQQMISDIFTVMHAYQNKGLISSGLIEQFFTNQLNLINSESKKTTFLKIKENLNVNRFYKKLSSDYTKYLQEKPYINMSSEVFL